MTIETLEKVHRCYEHLKQLNEDIKLLQKQADLASTGLGTTKINLTSVPLDYGKTSAESSFEIDPLSSQSWIAQLGNAIKEVQQKKEAEEAKIIKVEREISDVATLRILQVLIDEKYKEKVSYIGILKKLGICFPEDVLK